MISEWDSSREILILQQHLRALYDEMKDIEQDFKFGDISEAEYERSMAAIEKDIIYAEEELYG